MLISTITFTNCILYVSGIEKFDIYWHGGGPPIAMLFHLRRVSMIEKVVYYVIWKMLYYIIPLSLSEIE